MDWIAGADTPVSATLYDELAPLYAFERERMRNFPAIADFVTGEVPEDARTVGVGACGPGFLLERLSERFETAVGFDLSPRLLALARERTDAPVVVADLRTLVAPEAFDVFTGMGGSIAHLPIVDGQDTLPTVLACAEASLRPGGTLLLDFMARGALESGAVMTDSFDSERFGVERTVITTADPDSRTGLGATGYYTFAYELTDHETGDATRVGTTTPVRDYRPGALLGAVLNAGFAEARLVSPPTHGSGVVARKPG